MVKQIVRDVFFLGQKSEPATKDDLQVGRDLRIPYMPTVTAVSAWRLI